MATIAECRDALQRLAERLAANAEAQGKLNLDRSLSVELVDLGTGFHARLTGGQIVDITDGTDPGAKIKLSATSDDLIALINGELNFAKAWTSGRVSVKANVLDLMKLRSLL